MKDDLLTVFACALVVAAGVFLFAHWYVRRNDPDLD
jgi:hypothetical protein